MRLSLDGDRDVRQGGVGQSFEVKAVNQRERHECRHAAAESQPQLHHLADLAQCLINVLGCHVEGAGVGQFVEVVAGAYWLAVLVGADNVVVIAERLQLPFLTRQPRQEPALDVRQVADDQLFTRRRHDAAA